MTPFKAAIVAFIITLVGVLGFGYMLADKSSPGAFERGQMLGSGAMRLSLTVAIIVFIVVRLVKGPARDE